MDSQVETGTLWEARMFGRVSGGDGVPDSSRLFAAARLQVMQNLLVWGPGSDGGLSSAWGATSRSRCGAVWCSNQEDIVDGFLVPLSPVQVLSSQGGRSYALYPSWPRWARQLPAKILRSAESSSSSASLGWTLSLVAEQSNLVAG